jgi:ATP-dependent Clp protease adapter protein ClpS
MIMNNLAQPTTEHGIDIAETTDDGSEGFGGDWQTTLFNDNHSTFEDVVAAIIAATGYTASRAESIMWTAHNTGSAVVCSGTQDYCIKVHRVLRSAGLRATVSEVQK